MFINKQTKCIEDQAEENVELQRQIAAVVEDGPDDSNNLGRDLGKLDEDTFSIMMTSKLASNGWALGLCTVFSQMLLWVIIIIGQI